MLGMVTSASVDPTTYTATLLATPVQSGDMLECQVLITHNLGSETQIFKVSASSPNAQADLQAQVISYITSSDSKSTNQSTLVKGLALNLTPPLVTPPTTLPAADLQFQSDYQKYIRYSHAGIYPTGYDPVAAKATLQSTLSKNPTFEAYLF